MTTRRAVYTDEFPTPLQHVFSQAVISKEHIYCAGAIGLVKSTGSLAEGGVEAETAQTLSNLEAALRAAGSDLSKVIKVNVYLKSFANFSRMNEVYITRFAPPMPARTCVGVSELPFGAEVEIECVAEL